MEENLILNEPNNQESKRPQFLTILCVLSFIWSGFIIVMLFIALIMSGFIFNILNDLINGTSGMPPITSEQEVALQTLLNLGKSKFVALIAGFIIFYMTSLLGVFKMWKQQKTGFYIYAILNGLGLFYDAMSGSYFMVIVSLGFIAMYFLNLKHMTK